MSTENIIELEIPARSNEIATKSSWKNNSMLKISKGIECNYSFNDEEYSKIIRGFLPQVMEDKWFIYHEDGWLHFHRSWTGHEIYRAALIKEQDKYVIKEYFVEATMHGNHVEGGGASGIFDGLINKLLTD